MSKVLVFGASGQLGTCLKLVAKEKNLADIYFLGEEDGNILDREGLNKLFAKHRPAYIINCAAYTAVDRAEDEPQAAGRVNVEGVENLSEQCRDHGATFIHISTDFVFEGNSPLPLTEEDPAAPINVYGLTKLQGEQIIPTYTSQYFILRTSWLYSEYGNNFVKTMLRLGREKEELKIIADQVGTPTYAIDLAGCVVDLILSGNKNYGLYHYSNEGVSSWYDFAKAIFDIASVKVKVLPVPTSEYLTKAKRPAYSVMDKKKIKSTLNIEIPYWRDSLVRCIGRLQDITKEGIPGGN